METNWRNETLAFRLWHCGVWTEQRYVEYGDGRRVPNFDVPLPLQGDLAWEHLFLINPLRS